MGELRRHDAGGDAVLAVTPDGALQRGGVRGGGVRYPWILAIFLVEALVLAVVRLPVSQDFKLFAFYDPGSALKADGLLGAGLRPTVDFAYSYGLLPLCVGRGWFGVFGRTPRAYGVLTFLGSLAVAWGLARWVAACGNVGHRDTPGTDNPQSTATGDGGRAGWWAMALCMLALPYAIVPYYLNQTHMMEAALLVHALAEQARGRRGRALVLAAVCAFVKPSMAYAYGFLLVVCLLVQAVRIRRGLWPMVREMVPAGVLAGTLAAVLAWVYGAEPLVHTLLPLNASKSYKAAHFGFFFGVGREFWWPSTGRTAGYYLLTEAGFWIAATVLVTALGLWLLAKFWRRVQPAAVIETLICVVTLHLVFVFLLYAWKGSWTYYPYLLVMALVGTLRQVRVDWRRHFTAGMIILAIFGQCANAALLQNAWPWKVRGPETAGLWGYGDMVKEWGQVRERIKGRSEFLLTNGYVDRLSTPDLRGVESWFMSPALQTRPEMARLKKAVRHADVVVRWNELGELDPWLEEELKEETAGFELEWKGQYLTVMKRRATQQQ